MKKHQNVPQKPYGYTILLLKEHVCLQFVNSLDNKCPENSKKFVGKLFEEASWVYFQNVRIHYVVVHVSIFYYIPYECDHTLGEDHYNQL